MPHHHFRTSLDGIYESSDFEQDGTLCFCSTSFETVSLNNVNYLQILLFMLLHLAVRNLEFQGPSLSRTTPSHIMSAGREKTGSVWYTCHTMGLDELFNPVILWSAR